MDAVMTDRVAEVEHGVEITAPAWFYGEYVVGQFALASAAMRLQVSTLREAANRDELAKLQQHAVHELGLACRGSSLPQAQVQAMCAVINDAEPQLTAKSATSGGSCKVSDFLLVPLRRRQSEYGQPSPALTLVFALWLIALGGRTELGGAAGISDPLASGLRLLHDAMVCATAGYLTSKGLGIMLFARLLTDLGLLLQHEELFNELAADEVFISMFARSSTIAFRCGVYRAIEEALN